MLAAAADEAASAKANMPDAKDPRTRRLER